MSCPPDVLSCILGCVAFTGPNVNGSLNTIFPPRLASLLWKFKFGHTKQRGYILYKYRARVWLRQPRLRLRLSRIVSSQSSAKKERDKHSAVCGSSKKLSKLPSFRRLRHLPPIKLRFYVMSQHIVVANARRARVLILQRYSTVCSTRELL